MNFATSWSLTLNSGVSLSTAIEAELAAAIGGGIEVVKMKFGAKLLMQSIPSLGPTT
jgi:hypothetical protein